MNFKDKVWKYATAIVVILIVFNPEMIELALFIDAVGLEMFLMLIEIQLLAMMGALLNNKIKPAITRMKSFLCKYLLAEQLKKISEGAESLFLTVPSEAMLMYLIVVSAVIGGLFGVRM